MKSINVIKRLILILVLSLTATSTWSQGEDCVTIYIYESGDPSNMGDPKSQVICQDDPGGGKAVCLDMVGVNGNFYMYPAGDGDCGEGAIYWIPSTPLSNATILLVFFLGIYGIYLYRKRRLAV